MQGFIIQHAIGGGTGSGLAARILEVLSVDYRKTCIFDFSIYPSPNLCSSVVEPYNATLATYHNVEEADISMVLDNEALYGLCRKKLGVRAPDFSNINRIIAKVCSSVTAALRFKGELNVDMSDYQTNLVPFPRLHFMTSSIAPLVSKNDAEHSNPDARELTDQCLKPDNFLVSYPDYDVAEDKFMAVSLSYRGSVGAHDVNQAVQWVSDNDKLSFVSWCPNGFKLGLNNQVARSVENDDMHTFSRSCVMLGNNVAVTRVFNRFLKSYDMLWSQRAFVHWYVGEGLPEEEITGPRDDLRYLEKDYLDVLAEETLQDSEEEDYF